MSGYGSIMSEYGILLSEYDGISSRHAIFFIMIGGLTTPVIVILIHTGIFTTYVILSQ